MDTQQVPQEQEEASTQYPSISYIPCPECGKSDFTIIGAKGSKGKSFGVAFAFGAVGNLVANAMTKGDTTMVPISFKCKSCKHKFDSYPLVAPPEDILSAPCTITFTRKSAFAGIAVSQTVWLNGVKVASVSNGQTVELQTMSKRNIIFVSDQYGVAFKGSYKFEAQSGGHESVEFKQKFKED